ncbi:DUF4118 domain-containing protein [Litorilinea aerophila]|uniref:histidine kinase n=1 Tax=Litorilinea aerophila TaxID=1204385 RepID=A0A540VJW1_9CHLR|nr:ATP-binding protein [Litorilinea aerophila]MCC9075514.1 DUF4118 domain-containing protein [Litorilinea aerophila]OUC05659.1 hypothetical protein RY27_25865 [Litorilinea aerophila]
MFRNRWSSRLPTSWGSLLLVVSGIALVTVLHYATTPGLRELHAVYRYFYFLPIVYAALRFGFWGGVYTALAASLFFAPHIFFKWGDFPEDSLNDLLVVVVFCAVAAITGITVERLHRSQQQEQATARRLAATLQRLEAQGEELRRAEHLSALGTLAGGLAHEIRNPLGIIRATAQLLAMECGPEAAESLAIIQKEADRIERFIQELLNYAGESRLQRAPTPVAALLERVAGRLRPLLERYAIACRIHVAAGVSTAWLDGEQMEQALMNLCVNAIQALDGPGEIQLRASLEGEAWLALEVIDNGPGIAPPDRVRIFDPFYTTKDTGTGLGLSVVQRIVANHGGRITVDSTPGQGTTFTLLLPLDPGRTHSTSSKSRQKFADGFHQR